MRRPLEATAARMRQSVLQEISRGIAVDPSESLFVISGNTLTSSCTP